MIRSTPQSWRRYTRPLLLTTLLPLLCLQAGPAHAGQEQKQSIAPAVAEECNRIGNKLGSVSTRQCLNSQLQDSGARSVSGQTILIKEYPPLSHREPQARVLMLGGTHGDEYSSVSIVFKWMRTLDVHHSGLFHWHVAPLVNPDGLLQRRSQRLNANGVDLNRNMPTPDWHEKTKKYWQRTGHDPRRYPGTAPLSEPESKWLYEEIRSFKPHVIVSVHAPFGVLDFDGPPKGPSKLGQLHLKLIGTYPGSLGNSAGVQHQIPVITVELPYAGIMPSQAQTSRMWNDLIRWIRTNIPKEKTVLAHAAFDEISEKLLQKPNPGERVEPQPARIQPVSKPATADESHSHVHVQELIDG
ncbi:murein peptide amidase A [Mariprofundus micogutta]|uniref:Murein peptide amidase A n=1 Tax=Mariprofundus micogutta TaxID=1921010 RepID=A0A1L8CK55_9PROT|nr:M14 family murein peptide amidase A [Mariprofundus micogutta]GAV19281.1 murein peptide amidase A [Mariprofundus micogutta]